MRSKLTYTVSAATLIALVAAPPALAAADLNQVIDNLRVWLAGLLAALATLLLTIGGIRYLFAGGDPAALERAKGSIKAAIAGYALALLAPAAVPAPAPQPVTGAIVVVTGNIDPKLLRQAGVTHVAVALTGDNLRD